MRHVRIVAVMCLLFSAGLALLIGAPVAEDNHQKITSLELDAMTMEEILGAYESFYSRIDRMASNAREEMVTARSNGDSDAYREAYERYLDLASYEMDETETERLLTRILEEPEERREQFAQWLYTHSRHYRPMLTIDFSQEGEGFHYAYSHRIRQAPGTPITLPDASGMFAHAPRLGILKGWGPTPDSVAYEPGETISMPLTSQTLHAVWTSAVQFEDRKSGLSLLHSPVSEGDLIDVPTPEAPNDTYRFVGWFDRSSFTMLQHEEHYAVSGRGAQFEALWKHLAIEAIAPLYYGFDRIPVDRQIAVGLVLANNGSVPLRNLIARFTTESPHVTMLCDTLKLHDLPAGRYRTNNSRFATTARPTITGESNTFRFVISPSAPRRADIPFTLTVTDADGEQWESQVTFRVR